MLAPDGPPTVGSFRICDEALRRRRYLAAELMASATRWQPGGRSAGRTDTVELELWWRRHEQRRSLLNQSRARSSPIDTEQLSPARTRKARPAIDKKVGKRPRRLGGLLGIVESELGPDKDDRDHAQQYEFECQSQRQQSYPRRQGDQVTSRVGNRLSIGHPANLTKICRG